MEADKMRNKASHLSLPRLALGLVSLVAVVSLASCRRSSHVAGDHTVSVSILQVQSSSAVPAVTFVGTVEELSSVDLSFPTGGRVLSVFVREGEKVRKGQLLAVVDTANAASSHRAALATLRQAEDAYERARQVKADGSLPDVKWVEVQTTVDRARSLSEVAARNLADCSLTAPQDGTVADRRIEAGTTVSPFAPVMRLLDMSGLCVRASVPESDMRHVALGDVAWVEVPALDGQRFKAVVAERNVSADPLSHNYMVRFRLAESSARLLPGMVCRVAMVQPSDAATLVLPPRAVQIDHENNHYVWVVRHDTAWRRPVVVGDLVADGVSIADGLASGDSVVTDGAYKLSQGIRVACR